MSSFGPLLPLVGGGSSKGKGSGSRGFLKGRKRPTPGTGTSTSTSTTSTTQKKARALTQTYLDLGQRSHGKRTLCAACGMLYVNGEAEDERDHAAFCRSVDAALGFPGWKAERIVWGKEGKDRVMEVRPGDGPAALHKMGEVKRVVDQEMGFVPLAEGQKALGPQEKAFLFVTKAKRVVGCLVAEKIEAAFPVLEASEEEEGKENQEESGGQEQEQEGDEKAQAQALLPKGVAYSLKAKANASMGVKQIWVGQASRRQGVAKRLVEVARAKFYYGFVVPREQLAFSQLSTLGYAFARAYTAGQRLLVY